MKKVLFSIFYSIVTLTAYSQVDGNYNYSLGLRGFSLIQLPKVLNQTNSKDYTKTYLNGALIKFNDNQISYRLSGNYLKTNKSFNNQCANCEIATGELKDYSLKIGFEKSFNYSAIQPYFGTDIGFRSNNFTGKVTNVNIQNVAAPYHVEASKSGLLLGPIMGVKINFLKRFTVFAESGMDFYYAYERQETVAQNAANTRTFAKFTKWEFLFNPVSVGLQIHFVSTD